MAARVTTCRGRWSGRLRVLVACLCAAGTAAGAAASSAAGAAEDKTQADEAVKKLRAADGLLARNLPRLAEPEYEAFLAAWPKHPQAAEARYGLGLCRFRLGKYDQAAASLQEALRDAKFTPRDDALAVLAHCHLSGPSKSYDKALAVLEELLGKHPSSKQAELAALNRAQVLHLLGRYDQAVIACQEFVKKYPSSPRQASAEYALALAQHSLGKHAEAVEALAKLIRAPAAPFGVDARLLLGQCYEAQDKLDQAAREYQQAAAAASPDRQEEAYYSLGTALYKAGKYAESAGALAKALAGPSPGRYAAAARYQLGLAQVAGGKLGDARQTLAAVVKDDPPRAAGAKYWLAQCDLAERKYDSARAALGELAKARPAPDNLESILYDRAICAMALGDHAAAAAEFAGFRTAYPNSPRLAEATYRQAFCLHKQGQYDQSQALCQDLVKQPGLPIARAVRELSAENLFLTGKYAQAAGLLSELAKDAKDEGEGQGQGEGQRLRLALRLSQCAYFQGDYARAAELARPLADNRKVRDDPALRQAIFVLGDAQLQSGKYAEAAQNLAKYLPLAGQDKAETQYKLALALLRTGETAEAERGFAELVRGDPKSPWVLRGLFEQAQLAYKQGQAAKAEPILAKVLAAGPPADLAAAALYLQAWLDLDARRFAQAAERFGQFTSRFGSHELAEEAAYQQGVCLADAEKYQEALGALGGYLKTHPTGKHAPQARRRQARCLAKLNRHAEAAKILAAMAQGGAEGDDSILYELAWSQREGGDSVAAAGTYRRLLKEHAGSKYATSGRSELAEMLYAQEKFAEAAELLEQVTADKSADARTAAVARYRLGWCHMRLDQSAKAAEVFSTFSTLRTSAAKAAEAEFAPSAIYQAGACYAKLNRPDDAKKQFAALLAAYPKHDLAPAAMLKLGEIQAQTQDYDKSAETYAAFLKDYPDSKFAYLAQFGMGWSLENRRKYDQARQWYAKVVAGHNGPTAARAQFQTGECHFAEGAFEKAAAELLKVDIVYAYPEWSARALYEAGRAFEGAGQVEQAKAQYAACIAKYKDSVPAAQAASRLKELEGKRE